jgi:hypothetical protein
MATTIEYGPGLAVSIYEEHGAWCVDDGHGDRIAVGLHDMAEARRVAHRWIARKVADAEASTGDKQ